MRRKSCMLTFIFTKQNFISHDLVIMSSSNFETLYMKLNYNMLGHDSVP